MRGTFFTEMCDIENDADTDDLGIRKKIMNQITAFEQYGFDMTFCYGEVDGRQARYLNKLPLYRQHYEVEGSSFEGADFIYFRKPFTINMGFIDLLKCVRKMNKEALMLLEIPTYPYDKEIMGFHRLPLRWKDRYARRLLRNYIHAIVTYSNDVEIFGIQTIRTSNGVDSESIAAEVNRRGTTNDSSIHLLACAQFCDWHGYDRVIEGLGNYYRTQKNPRDVRLEFVGNGSVLEKYKSLVRKYDLGTRVVFHGQLDGDSLWDVYARCDIGLDSMGRHRSGIYYNSSLKGKEYCACGLPIVSGVETEFDRAGDFPYYFRVPADDTPVDIAEVLRFYDQMVAVSGSAETMRNEISNYARAHYSMEAVIKPVVDFICANREGSFHKCGNRHSASHTFSSDGKTSDADGARRSSVAPGT